MKKSSLIHLSLSLLLVSFLYACAPEYGRHFSKSRSFYQEATPVASMAKAEVPVAVPSTVPDQLTASTENVVTPIALPKVEAIVAKHQANVVALENADLDKKAFEKEVKREHRRAKKEVIKEIKAEIKSTKENKAMSSSQKVYVGIIVALAGLVVAILASGSIGGLAIIVGVALIAWGLIEQGM